MIIDEKTTTKLNELVQFEVHIYLAKATKPCPKEFWEFCKEQQKDFMLDEALTTVRHDPYDLAFLKNILERHDKVGNLLGFDMKKENKGIAVKAVLGTINNIRINYDVLEPYIGPFDSPFLFIPLLLEFFEIQIYEHKHIVNAIKRACEIFLEDKKTDLFIDLIDKTGFLVANDKNIVKKIKDNIRETIASYGEGQDNFGPEMIESLLEIGKIDPATLKIPVATFLEELHEIDDWIIRMASILYPSNTCND